MSNPVTGKTMRILLVTLLISLVGTAVLCAPLPEAEVIRTAEAWLAQGEAMPRINARISRSIPYQVAGETLAYIFELVGGGYCLSGADDLQLPVYLYVPEGEYDPTQPVNIYYLSAIADRLLIARQAVAGTVVGPGPDAAQLSRRQNIWQDWRSGLLQPAKAAATYTPDSIILPLHSMWGQGDPYFNDCPQLGNYGPTKVGCVATGMSQVMNYWQWPTTGTGSFNRVWEYRHSDTWQVRLLTNDPNIPAGYADRLVWQNGSLRMTGYWDYNSYWIANTFNDTDQEYLDAMALLFDALQPYYDDNAVNFAAQTYDWSLIGDVHDGSDSIADQEVAKFCYHVGVSLDMLWGIVESYTGLDKVAPALIDYFRYDPDAQPVASDYATVVAEIQWGRPVVLSATIPGGGGHSFVLCGYDATTTPESLVMNLGWGGGSVLSAFDDLAGYTESQWIARHIAPLGAVRFVGGAISGDGSPAEPYNDFMTAVNVSPPNTTLIMRANSQFSIGGGPVVFAKAQVFQGGGVVIR